MYTYVSVASGIAQSYCRYVVWHVVCHVAELYNLNCKILYAYQVCGGRGDCNAAWLADLARCLIIVVCKPLLGLAVLGYFLFVKRVFHGVSRVTCGWHT
jgi:hypothetical protein